GGMYVVCAGAALSTLLFAAVNFTFLPAGWISANAVCIYGLLLLLYMLLSRSVVRELMSFRRGERERVAIYGAGAAGVQLARSLRESGQYVPVVFVDDEPTLWGRVVAGMRVRSPAALPSLIRRKGVSSVLLAVPSCSRRRRQAILKRLEPLPVHVRTVPDISDILAGYATVADVREV